MSTPSRPMPEAPARPHYPPGQCNAPAHRDIPTVRCDASPAHPYPCGWRCDPHSPAALRTSRETSPTRMENAA